MNKVNEKIYNMRPIEKSDLNLLLEWRNSEHVRSKMFTDHTISLDEHHAWFERIEQQASPLHFIFELEEKPIGYISYSDVNWLSGTCTSGLYIGEKKDIPEIAGLLIEFSTIEYAFEKLNMRKIWGHIFSFNQRVIKLHKFFGYKQEGILVDHILKNGKFENLLIMSLFKSDWEAQKSRLTKYINI